MFSTEFVSTGAPFFFFYSAGNDDAGFLSELIETDIKTFGVGVALKINALANPGAITQEQKLYFARGPHIINPTFEFDRLPNIIF